MSEDPSRITVRRAQLEGALANLKLILRRADLDLMQEDDLDYEQLLNDLVEQTDAVIHQLEHLIKNGKGGKR